MADDEIEYDYGDDNDDLAMKRVVSDGRVASDGPAVARRRSRSPPPPSGRTAEDKRTRPTDEAATHPDRPPSRPSSRQYDADSDHRHRDREHDRQHQSRFFVLKCEFYSVFAQSKRTRVWPARRVVGDRLDNFYKQGHHVGLFFTLEKARCFVGMAWMTGRVVDGGRFSEVPLKYLAFKDVNFDDFGRDIPEDLFADAARATIRDGVELGGHCGRLLERAFLDPKYGVDPRGYHDDGNTGGGSALAPARHHHDRHERDRRDRHH